MRITSITLLALTGPALASLFFEDSRSDKIKANLANIGYEIMDSAGLVKDSVFDSFDRESIENWLAAHGVYDVGNDFLNVAKEHKDWLVEDIKEYAQSGQDNAAKFVEKGKEFYTTKADELNSAAWNSWSDSKLKEFLDARGIDVPQQSTRDQLLALVSRAKHNSPFNFKGPSGNYWFDGWSREELANKLREFDQSVEGTRKELAHRLFTAYTNSFEAGKEKGDKAAESFSKTLGSWKEATAETFNKWSVEDLKEYLQEFGADASNTRESLIQSAKDHYNYFVHGETTPKGPLQTLQYHVKDHFYKVGSALRDYASRIFGSQTFFHVDL